MDIETAFFNVANYRFDSRYKFVAWVDARGTRRTIDDHLLCRLETIIAKTVRIGSSVSNEGAIILPPL